MGKGTSAIFIKLQRGTPFRLKDIVFAGPVYIDN